MPSQKEVEDQFLAESGIEMSVEQFDRVTHLLMMFGGQDERIITTVVKVGDCTAQLIQGFLKFKIHETTPIEVTSHREDGIYHRLGAIFVKNNHSSWSIQWTREIRP